MSNCIFLLDYLANKFWDALEYVDRFWFRISTKTNPKTSSQHQWVVTNIPP